MSQLTAAFLELGLEEFWPGAATHRDPTEVWIPLNITQLSASSHMGICWCWKWGRLCTASTDGICSPWGKRGDGGGAWGSSLADGVDVIAGEEANASIDLSLPPVGVGAVQHLNDVPTVEGQLGAVMSREVELGLHEFGSLHLQGNPKQRR